VVGSAGGNRWRIAWGFRKTDSVFTAWIASYLIFSNFSFCRDSTFPA
jgi:hypothetical protein